MKTFGLADPKGAGRVLEGHVRSLLTDNAGLEQIIMPLLDAWRACAPVIPVA
jgi:transposase